MSGLLLLRVSVHVYIYVYALLWCVYDVCVWVSVCVFALYETGMEG